jgi:hypothetical protein
LSVRDIIRKCLEKAREIVEGNYGDIAENGNYKWVVIEITDEGLYPNTREIWYRWNGKKYVEAGKPWFMSKVVNFGLG